jgi:hypothetical protein
MHLFSLQAPALIPAGFMAALDKHVHLLDAAHHVSNWGEKITAWRHDSTEPKEALSAETAKSKRRRRKEGRTLGGKKRKPVLVISLKPSDPGSDFSLREAGHAHVCKGPAEVPEDLVHKISQQSGGRIRARPGWAQDLTSEANTTEFVSEECDMTFRSSQALGSHRTRQSHDGQKGSASAGPASAAAWSRSDHLGMSAAECMEQAVKEEAREELVSPISTLEDICSPRCSDGGINGQLKLNSSPGGSRRLPSPFAAVVGCSSFWSELESDEKESSAEAVRRVAGCDGKGRIQFVAREGESLGQILCQVCPTAFCC